MNATLRPISRVFLAQVGLVMALALRITVAGDAGLQSVRAGLIFAGALLLIALAAGWRPAIPRLGPLFIGVLGAVGLLAAPAWMWFTGTASTVALPADAFLLWAGVITTVAVAEELLLRGILFTLIENSHGLVPALAITSAVFAVLHVPLYGWHALPLDLAVGLWLGGLRVVSGTVTAPAVAHTIADVATWWLA